MFIIAVLFPVLVVGQNEDAGSSPYLFKSVTDSGWEPSIHFKGYIQMRYHGQMSNPDLGCDQCDKAWGDNGGFSMRRVRLGVSGMVTPRMSYSVQADFASSANSSHNIAQLRDAYLELALTADNTIRLRLGQSKVPFGFEMLQSSSNRIPLDRSDGLNSGLANERDLGVFLFWTPDHRKKIFREMVDAGHKGTGDYGVFALGVFSGQTANHVDLNRQPHVVARVAYPFKWSRQWIETGIQAYYGQYVMDPAELTGLAMARNDRSYTDYRVAGSFVWHPQPIGLQIEYNWGLGPEYRPSSNRIEQRPLEGGYAMLNTKWDLRNQTCIPFIRAHQYAGGKKHELDARSYRVQEFELGMEWTLDKHFELTAMYTFSSRRYEDGLLPNNHQKGRLLRLQAQMSF